ncbi:undecaprenyl-phosphate 4-deoxy-4-formamido-L-arabinose transferase [Runella defluvii]|uniref:Undecaprenyl-phosphate 4-deoxy-4-formamido-L-arabinose transferase n=1 Tax=Runella defluvii TaxID=370973 RepID=A0A7W5ZFX5_9BACT|nr:glycosyltransferase family 2 protein [Runella defluvii]MBB3836094.1 undecaprenyl-phosphate 4-deoxy-4-formamido-L-arabinose transferase [Runella defluvii]
MLLSVIIPVYNSEQTINRLVEHVLETLNRTTLEIVLVNDGSRDRSEQVCTELAKRFSEVKFISLRRNSGEFNAVMCGLNHASGDYCVMIDDDFQNPPTEILKLVETAQQGDYDVVYSFYATKKHSWFRNFGSWLVNRVTTWLLEKPNDLYLSSFKLINQAVVQEIIKYKGPYPYLDGLIFRVTRNVGRVQVSHNAREEGESGYTLRKLTSLFMTILFGYSLKPLRLLTATGLAFSGFSLLAVLIDLVLYAIHSEFFILNSVLILLTFFSGLILTCLGIVGEYIGRIFMTQSGLPQYVEKMVVTKEPQIKK